MKLKKVLAILLTTAMVMSMSVGNVVLAADVNPQTEVQQVENTAGSTSEREQTQKEDQKTETGENEKEDQKTETGENEKGDQKASEEETAEETQKESAAENREKKQQESQEEISQAREEEEIETQAAATAYLNQATGSDSKTGTTSADAVKTLDKAKTLAGAGGTIYVTGSTLRIENSTTLSDNITIKRDSGLAEGVPLIMVENHATLTVENATIDGAQKGQLICAQSANVQIENGAKICNSRDSAIRVADGKLTMNGGEICNNLGRTAGGSGAVQIGKSLGVSTFVMNGGKIYNNTSGGASGSAAVHVDADCTFTMIDGEIYGNHTPGNGGAIDSAGTVNIQGGTIHGNSAEKAGGAIHMFDKGIVTITDGTIRDNTAGTGGGAFDLSGNTTLDIAGGTVTANTAAWGGAVCAYGNATVKLRGTAEIKENTTTANAAGVFLEGAGTTFTMTGGSITGNRAGGSGGGVYLYDHSQFNMTEGSITGNQVTGTKSSGGGVVVTNGSRFDMSGGRINSNTSTTGYGGGGIAMWDSGTLNITGGEIASNKANCGAGIRAIDDSTVSLGGTGVIKNNSIDSEGNGAGVFLEGGSGNGTSFTMTGGKIIGNQTQGTGGGIFAYTWKAPVTLSISGGEISGNQAEWAAPGICIMGDPDNVVYAPTMKLSNSPVIKDEVFLDSEKFNNAKIDVIGRLGTQEPVPIYDNTWDDYRTIVAYAPGVEVNTDNFKNARGIETQALIKDGQNLQTVNKLTVAFVEKGYIADGNHTSYKSMLLLPNEKISKAEIPTVDNKPGYKVIGWKNSDTDTDWNFDQDVVTGSLYLYPVFQLEPAVFELKADKDHLHGEGGDKITLTTEFTAHGANNISYEWKWYKDGALVKDGKNVDRLEVTEPGTYKVIVIADDGRLHSDGVEKSITITKTDHVYGAGWESDATQHWRTCNECQNKADVAAHIFGDWSVETQQTRTAGTVKVRSCQVCGYEERINVQPQTFDVVFKEADGSKEYGTIQVEENGKIDQTQVPTAAREGYTLTGWKSADGEWDFVNDAVTGRTELYPVWKLNAPKIDLSPNKDHLHEDETQELTLTAGITDLKDTLTYTYKWYREGNVIAGAQDAILRITEPGAYKVEVTANDGNISSDVASKELTITKTNHEYGTSWESDATQHWKTCNECQKKADVAAHIFGDWSVETQQTRAAGTVKVRSCQVCGYEERVTVPAEPGEEKNISVSYEFTSKTKDAQLPSEVLALLPKDTNSYAKGEAVRAIQPEKTTVKVTNGTWKFEGYDADEKEAVTGLIFTGSWSFTKDRTTDEDKNPTNPTNPTNPGNPDQEKPGTDNQGNGNQNKGQTQNGTSGNNTAVKGNTASKTGDFSQIGVNMVLTLLSGLLLAGFAGRTRRRKNRYLRKDNV